MSESLVKFVAERCGLPGALGKKRQRHPRIDGYTQGVPVGCRPPDPLRLPPEAQFVAQPDRDRVRDHPPEAPAGRKLHVGDGPGIAVAGIHGLLQRHDGPPLRLDLPRALMMKPKLLILDEPTLGLAPVILEQLSKALERLRTTTTISVLRSEEHTSE